MRIGTFPEALRSLKERYRKNVIENRVMMVLLWVQLALIVGFFCSYLVIRVSSTYAIGFVEAHPHQPANIDWLANVSWIGFWLFVVGLPILALILGSMGILPGTRRKSRYEI
jgi:ABC-type Fe3+ transport system permease subunit